ncbi:MAG: hypothetical protein IJN64_16815 [Lachnospiraceae bacterium]|nr:hypothetical protein [Lachnospiraceae bacterium]
MREENLTRIAENSVSTVEKNPESDTYYHLFTRYSSTRVDERIVSIMENTNNTNGATQNGIWMHQE